MDNVKSNTLFCEGRLRELEQEMQRVPPGRKHPMENNKRVLLPGLDFCSKAGAFYSHTKGGNRE